MTEKYNSILNTVGTWQIDVNAKGALIIKKGSWRVNRRLWKPRYYVEKGEKFPDAVPKYVREAVREAWKKV